MSSPQPAYYTRTGSRWGDFVSLLHVPYTLWHLSYVAIGASLAADLDPLRLMGTIVAFGSGLGIGAHALDELHDRPLGTSLSRRTLLLLGWGGLAGGAALALAGAFVVSPLALAWGGVGVLLAAAYALEWSRVVHSLPGFGLAWGAFPVLVGYWAQTGAVHLQAVLVAAAATVLAMTQRTLSTPARHVRRRAPHASAVVGAQRWERDDLLATWEQPLRLLALAHVVLATGLVAAAIARG